MISVPPTALRVNWDSTDLVNRRDIAESFVDYAALNREVAVIVGDEVVAGDLLVTAAVFLNITHINVLVEHGDAEERRREYAANNSAHGVTIPT
jgi:hypothetical protein